MPIWFASPNVPAAVPTCFLNVSAAKRRRHLTLRTGIANTARPKTNTRSATTSGWPLSYIFPCLSRSFAGPSSLATNQFVFEGGTQDKRTDCNHTLLHAQPMHRSKALTTQRQRRQGQPTRSQPGQRPPQRRGRQRARRSRRLRRGPRRRAVRRRRGTKGHPPWARRW